MLCTVASILPCQARLDETVEQSKARYGTPGEVKDANFLQQNVIEKCQVFGKGGFKIQLGYNRGVVVAEVFFHPDHSALTADEKQVLLNADEDISPWVVTGSKDNVPCQWYKIGRVALYTKDDTMCFYTEDQYNAMRKKAVSDKTTNMKDF